MTDPGKKIRGLQVSVVAGLMLAGCGKSPDVTRTSGADLRFAEAKDYPAELLTSFGSASPIDVADFDRDGYTDLVIGNTGGGPVLLLGEPGGAFGPPAIIGAYLDTDSYVVRAADFNGDGLSDVAAGSYGTTRITVLLGDGHGNFSVGDQHLLGIPPTDFAIADYNRDGKPDIAGATYVGPTLTMLLGNGDGTFDAAPSVPGGNSTLVLFPEDFNDDGIPDLAYTDFAPTEMPLVSTLNILFGIGDATFRPKVAYPIGTISEVIQYGDLDEDGKQDLLVANAVSNEVSILYGLGDGDFAAERRFSVGTPLGLMEGMRLADFDRDGHLDLAITQITTNTLSVFKGDGRGNLMKVGEYAVANFPEQFLAVDLDGDDCLDLAVNGNLPPVGPSDVGTARVSIFINQSKGCR